MNKMNMKEKEILLKETRVMRWEKKRTLPRIVQTVRVMNNLPAPGLGGISNEY